MKKLLLFAAFFAAMSMNVLADGIKLHVGNDNVPEYVSKFLKTSVGKNFNEAQVLSAIQTPRRVEVGDNVQVNVLLNEDFSKFTAGSEDAPDATDVMDLENSDDFFNTPGWSGTEVYQAGGKAFFNMGVTDDGQDNPGYLMTPDIDLSQNQGIYRVKFRIKNVNENAVGIPLQYFVLNNDPDDSKKGIILANSLPMSNEEFTDVEFVGASGVQYTSFMFLSWRGKILVDNVTVEELIFPLAVPQNICMQLVSGNTVKATWDAVEGATSYVVSLVQDGQELTKVETQDTEAVLTANFVPGVNLGVQVVAYNGADNSYPGSHYEKLMPAEVGEAVALDATDVTENGFTANWEEAPFAANYTLYVDRTHEVTEDGEEFTYLYEDFSEVPYESSDDPNSTIVTQDGLPVLLDGIINYPGWSVFLASVFKGVLAISNMYEAYGIPGVLMGPETDFSYGGGKVNVSGMCASLVDDAVLKIGFAELGVNPATWMYQVQFEEGAQEVEVSQEGTLFSVDLEGGAPGKKIFLQMTDGAESGDMVVFLALSISTQLQVGDVVTGSYKTYNVPAGNNSFYVEAPMAENDKYYYYLVGSYGDMKGGKSNVIEVKKSDAIQQIASSNGHIVITDSGIRVNNPDNLGVAVFSVDGSQVSRISNEAVVNVPVNHGAYIVRIGNDTFKVVR